MLLLLRKIRRTLMKNLPTVVGNKFTTYLLYAIGEIVLVVIGILIAVSMNNWNEQRKTRQTERTTLQSLLNEFNSNLEKLEARKVQADTIIENISEIANLIVEEEFSPDPERMPFLLFNITLRTPVLRLSDGVLNEVINSGKLNIIQNDELRAKLGAFESRKVTLEGHQDYVEGNMIKVLEAQLNLGNFRRHVQMLNPEAYHQELGLAPSNRPFDFSYLKSAKYENDLIMYAASLNAYRKGTLSGLRSYLTTTSQLIEQELAK